VVGIADVSFSLTTNIPPCMLLLCYPRARAVREMAKY